MQLLETRHALQKKDNHTTTFHRFNRARQQIGGQGLKVLQHQHTKRSTENLGRVFVVAVPDICDAHEKLEWILCILIPHATLDIALDFGFALLSVCRKSQLFLVAPQDIGSCLNAGLG